MPLRTLIKAADVIDRTGLWESCNFENFASISDEIGRGLHPQLVS